jgi:hypothetical protein
VADLGALRDLCAWMRAERVTYARCGELELRLDPLPLPVVVDSSESPPAEPDDDDERRSLETLLHSTGVDPSALLSRFRKAG